MGTDGGRPAPRAALRSGAELFALSGLAIAQPLFDTFGRAPDVFLAHGADRADMVRFGVLVLVVPPALLWLVEQGVGLVHRGAARVLHGALVVGLATAAVLQFLKLSADLTGRRLALVVAVVAVGFAVAYTRWAVVRRWVVVMAPAPLFFLAAFLVASPVAELYGADEVDAAAGVGAGNGRSVVMVVTDELPMDVLIDGTGRIDADLYPNLAALADEATFFRNTGTAATVTAVAVPALLTGQAPENGLAPTAADHPENLFTLLGEAYDLEAVETTTSLCPAALCAGPMVDRAPETALQATDDGLGGLLEDARSAVRDMVSFDPYAGPQPVPLETVAVEAERTEAGADPGADLDAGFEAPTYQIADVEDFVASIEEEEGPTLHFLHVQLPHSPYVFTPDGRAYQDRSSIESMLEIAGRRSDQPYETDLARQRLVLQTQYVDGIVGQVRDRLEVTGLADDSVVVLTSDHGVGLVPGEEKRPISGDAPVAEAIYPDLLYVPLLVEAPGLAAGAVDDRNAMTIDVLPTIADLLDVDLPWPVDGRSLVGDEARASPEKRFVQVLPRDATGAFGFEVTGTRGPAAIGPPVTYDGATWFRRALDRDLDELFRGRNPDHPAFDLVAGGELVGVALDEIGPGAAGPGAARIDDLEALRSYPASAPFAPLRVRGRLEGVGGDAVTLAVAVDEIVAGVAPTFASGEDTHRFDLMLAPELVAPGEHRVEVFLIEGADGRRRLRPVPLS